MNVSQENKKEVSHAKQKLYLGRVRISGGDIFHSQDSDYDGFTWVAGIKNMKGRNTENAYKY